MNEILHFFNLHISPYDEFVKHRKQSKKNKVLRRKNKLYRDILRGLKKNELMLLHANVKRIEKIVDEFLPLENIFVPF